MSVHRATDFEVKDQDACEGCTDQGRQHRRTKVDGIVIEPVGIPDQKDRERQSPDQGSVPHERRAFLPRQPPARVGSRTDHENRAWRH